MCYHDEALGVLKVWKKSCTNQSCTEFFSSWNVFLSSPPGLSHDGRRQDHLGLKEGHHLHSESDKNDDNPGSLQDCHVHGRQALIWSGESGLDHEGQVAQSSCLWYWDCWSSVLVHRQGQVRTKRGSCRPRVGLQKAHELQWKWTETRERWSESEQRPDWTQPLKDMKGERLK